MGELADMEVLAVDCQSTGAHPGCGALLEIGWARVRAAEPPDADRVASHLLALPQGAVLPPRVARLTGIGEADLARGIAPADAWQRLLAAAGEAARIPAIAHCARFERGFLVHLCGGAADPERPLPFELLCTLDIARRLLPELPRRGLRALAGYFGMSVAPPRRAADHVRATAFLWRQLVALLAEPHGVDSAEALRAWLAVPAPAPHGGRSYPMPRARRLALPDAPGVYRILRGNGDPLYVGKATSLRSRVNSHFRGRAGLGDRALEMLTQARDVEVTIAETAVEAALMEVDEIRRLRPPYNVALNGEQGVWFASKDLAEARTWPGRRFPIGPLPVADLMRWMDRQTETETEAETETDGVQAPSPRAAGGGSGWGAATETEIENDGETAEERVARVMRRARWLVRLCESAVGFRVGERVRILVVRGGVVQGYWGEKLPAVSWRSRRERMRCFDRVTYDRMRVLTTELRRVVGESPWVGVRLADRLLEGDRLVRALRWV